MATAAEKRLENYREVIAKWGKIATTNGADPATVNTILAHVGVPPLPASARRARYLAQVWVEVDTEDMSDQGAKDEVDRYIRVNNDIGWISNSDRSTGHTMVPGSIQWKDSEGEWVDNDTYWAPKDTTTDPTALTTLTKIKEYLRKELLILASTHGWSCYVFTTAWRELDLGELPSSEFETRTVPVTGTALVNVRVFDGLTADDVEKIVTAKINAGGGEITNTTPTGHSQS